MTLVALLVSFLVAAVTVVGAASPTLAAPTPSDEPVVTANPFLPDEQNLTDCVGLVERPGCGNESRGGLHQNLVAIVMVAGLVLVFGRVAWLMRRSSKRAADSVPTD